MLSNFRTPLLVLTILSATALLALTGCGNKSKELIGSADKLYESAKKASDNGNYRDAISSLPASVRTELATITGRVSQSTFVFVLTILPSSKKSKSLSRSFST